MTKADLYKRRNKNKQRKSSSSPAASRASSPSRRDSLQRDLDLIQGAAPEPAFDDDDIPSVKPVEKTYAKARSKLDDYVYIESSRGLDGTELAFPATARARRSRERPEPEPVPRKRRKVDVRHARQELNGDRELRSRTDARVERALRSGSAGEREKDKKRPTKESIENEKTVATRATRKRKREETAKPVLREKGQNGPSRKSSVEPEAPVRKIARAKRTRPAPPPLKLEVEQNVRMTRSRRRRLEISLSPSQVRSVAPAFSFESAESSRSARSTPRRAPARKNVKTKAKKPPVRSVRTRAARR